MSKKEYLQAKKEFLACRPVFANSYTIVWQSFKKAEASPKTDDTRRNIFISGWEYYKTHSNEVRYGDQ